MPKIYGVLLTDEGWSQLEEALTPYTSQGEIGKYIYCKNVHPDGPYFVIEATAHNRPSTFQPEGSSLDVEMLIPHRFVKFVISASDKAHIGFMR